MDANCDGLRAALEKLEFSKEEIDSMTVDDLGFFDNNKIDNKLNQFLLAYTDSTAMTFVENAHGSGFEAWRKLTAKYDPMSAQAGFNKMGGLVHPTKAKSELQISSKIEQWEAEERKYIERTRNRIPDDFRLEILVQMLPKQLEDEFRQRIIAPDASDLEQALRQFLSQIPLSPRLSEMGVLPQNLRHATQAIAGRSDITETAAAAALEDVF